MNAASPPIVEAFHDAELALVTGANGYVGAVVARQLLLAGHMRVRCLVRSLPPRRLEAAIRGAPCSEPEVMVGNLLSSADCQRAVDGVSVIYHLAAGVEKSYAGCVLNSAVATRNLLNAAATQSTLKRIVNVSTIAVYSNHDLRRGAVIDERCPMDSRLVERREPYTYAKAMQDEVVREHAKRLGLPCVTVRPGVVFGPGKSKISDRVGTATFGVFLHLGLGNRIPLTYIDNCADAIMMAGLQPGVEGEVLNIVDDDLPTSRQFLRGYKQRVRRFFSLPVPYPLWYGFCRVWDKYSKWSEGQLPPVFNGRSCTVYWRGNDWSNEKAKLLLGWSPRVPMAQALDNYFCYLNEQRSWPQ